MNEKEARENLAARLARIVMGTEHGDDVALGPYIANEFADAIGEYFGALAVKPVGRRSIRNCHVESREGEVEPLFTAPGGDCLVRLDGYAIIPIEEYRRLKAAQPIQEA